MENQIDLETIVNFLVNIKSTKKLKPRTPNDKLDLNYLEYLNSSQFSKFFEYFGNHIDRVGIRTKNKNTDSLYFSLLYIFYDDFCLLDHEQQNYLIKVLKSKIVDDLLNRKFKLPKDLTKKIATNSVKSETNSYVDAYILSIFFNVNIFIFSYETDDITSFYKDDKLNLYKINIFINEINNTFYPLIYKSENGKYFKYNSTILNKVVFSNKVKSYNYKNKKEFDLANTWEEILNEYLNIDLSNIIIDADNNKISTLVDLLDSDDSDNLINFNNLSDEIKNINNEENINSDDLSLDSNSSENDNIKFEDKANNIVNEIKSLSDSKLNKLTKDEIINYLKVFKNNQEINDKLKKNELITNLKDELSKFI